MTAMAASKIAAPMVEVFPAIAQAVASLLLLLSCGGENGAMVDAAELSSISVEAPSQWVWPLDSGVGT